MPGEGVPGFAGRERVLGLLASELAAAGSQSRIVLVEGEPGIGKSSVVRAFARRAGVSMCLWASAAEEEGSLAFGVLSGLDRGLKSAGRDGLTLLQRLGEDAGPFAVGAELLAVLGEMDGPAVVVVDDLHWSDEQSARALLFALRRLEHEPVLVVLTARPALLPQLGGGWERLLADTARVRRVPLAGLPPAELRELARVTGGGALTAVGAERLHAHTHGHPLHARALLEELGTAVLNTTPGVLPAPRSLAAVILAKVAALGGPSRDLLAAASVLGAVSPLPVAGAIGAVPDPMSAVAGPVEAGLLDRLSAGEVRFSHPLVRAAIYNDLPPDRRAALHLAAAAATDGLAALGHRAAAADGADPLLAGEVEALGVAALKAGRMGVASGHLRTAARLWAEPADRDRCLLLSVEAEFGGGDHARARSLRPAVESCGATPLRSYVLGCVEFAEGRLREAETLMARAIADLTQAPDGLEARAAAWLSTLRMMLGRWEEALPPARVAAREQTWARGMARFTLAICLSQLGQIGELRKLLDDLSAEVTGGGRSSLDTLIAVGVVKLWTNDFEGGAADLAVVAERARAGESSHQLALGLSFLAEAQFRLGKWDLAVVHSELAVSLALDTNQVVALQHAHEVASYVHAWQGQFEVSQQHADAATAISALIPWWGAAVGAAIARVTLATARGDAGKLLSEVSALLASPMWPSFEADARMGPWWVLAADALVDAGDLGRAAKVLAAVDDLAHTRGLRSLRTDAARLAGRLAEAGGDPATAHSRYEAGLRSPGTLPLPLARLELAHGSLLRRMGERRRAIDHLRRARQQLAAMGAARLLDECDRELSACGLRAPAAGRHPLALTPAELAVAHLVAGGHSNREVAARLYVSVKAVEYHLGHVYAKLGISSRRLLAARLPGFASPGGSQETAPPRRRK